MQSNDYARKLSLSLNNDINYHLKHFFNDINLYSRLDKEKLHDLLTYKLIFKSCTFKTVKI